MAPSAATRAPSFFGRGFGGGQRLAAGSDLLAAKAEAAIDRAHMHRRQQHAVGIAVHDALYRAFGVVADGIGALPGRVHELARVGQELPRDRIGRIGRIDEPGEIGRDRHRIARHDALQLGAPFGHVEARGGEVADAAHCARGRQRARFGLAHGARYSPTARAPEAA
jgi:hypothetical protein